MRLYKVLKEDLTSPFQGFRFELGKKYVCEDFDDSDIDCASGFYATDFNGLVYSLNKEGTKHSVFEVEVGGKSKEFDQFKRRFEEITVLRQLSEDEVKAGLLFCEETERYKALEACYPVNPFIIEPIPLEDALVLLEQWKKVRNSAIESLWDSLWDSTWNSVRGLVWGSVWASVRGSVWNSVKVSVRASVWASVRGLACAYTSSLFPNVRKWEYVEHAEGVNPFQSGIDLWKGGYISTFDGDTWRLHTKNGIAWEEK